MILPVRPGYKIRALLILPCQTVNQQFFLPAHRCRKPSYGLQSDLHLTGRIAPFLPRSKRLTSKPQCPRTCSKPNSQVSPIISSALHDDPRILSAREKPHHHRGGTGRPILAEHIRVTNTPRTFFLFTRIPVGLMLQLPIEAMTNDLKHVAVTASQYDARLRASRCGDPISCPTIW